MKTKLRPQYYRIKRVLEMVREGTQSGCETENLTVISEDHVRLNQSLWAYVAKYTSRSERVSLIYRKFNGETKTYMVESYHLFAYHGNWCLLALRENRDKPWQ